MTSTMFTSRMRARVFASATLITLLAAHPVLAQDPPPKIGPYVVDLHATIPRFPDDQQLAQSRGMLLAELPGSGLGVQVGVPVYPVRWRAVTFGIGGEFATGRAKQTPTAAQVSLRPSTERFTTLRRRRAVVHEETRRLQLRRALLRDQSRHAVLRRCPWQSQDHAARDWRRRVGPVITSSAKSSIHQLLE